MRNTGWKEYTEDGRKYRIRARYGFDREFAAKYARARPVRPLWEAYQRAEKRGLCLIDCHINCKCERRRA